MERINEDVSEFICNYEEASVVYDLESELKLCYLHSLFAGEAKLFYTT